MAKRIKIIPVLDTKTLFKQLKQLGNRKQKINIGVNGSGLNNTVQQLHQMNKVGNTSTSIFGKLKSVIKDTFSEAKIITTAYLAVLNMIYKAGTKAKEAIEDIDESITNISVATNLSRKATADLVGEYNQYARELKATTKDVTDAADDWLRAGKTMEEAKELIKDSTMLSKLGQIAPTEATEDLLATMNGYELSVQQTGEALDAMVAIDMRAATSAGDLATGLKYSASSAYSAGVSLNKLLGILGAVQDKTQQTSQVVGTFANTLLSRYRDITIGKYLTEDGEDISNYEATLKSIGISLRDSQGEFRSFETVLGEMANKWDTLSSVQQNALIKVAAGTRQQNRFIALMEGYNKVLELTEVAANSAGTAIEKYNNSYADSLEAKQNELQSSFEALIMNNDFSKVYGDIIDATTALVDFINQTNALKGVATSFAVAGFIKGFLSIRTGINEAYISLNQFHSALDLVQKKKLSTKEFNRLLLLTNKLSESQTRMILSSKNLSIRQKEQILVAQGLTKEEAKLKLQTLGLTNAQTGLTASTISLKNAAKGLLAYIAANPLTVLLTAISTASMVFSSYKNHLEELRQTAQDGANAYKESASSIDDYVAKYQDLRQALIEAKGNEEETYNVKQQLLSLQNELNSKFGEEYGMINLLANGYEDMTEAIKAYNKESAKTFLNENREGIQTATKKMTKERDYVLSGVNVSVDTPEGKALNEIVQSYVDDGMKLLNTGEGTVQIHLTANAENAYETINNFSNDLRDKAKELGDENLFADILDMSSISMNDAKDTVEDYGDIYKQALMAELVSDDDMSAVYNEALNAVEQYNNAVASSPDPYSDENVANAKKNLDEVRAKIDGNFEEWGKYSAVTDDLFEQADTKLLDFNNELTSNKDLIKDAMSLKGYSDLDLQAFNPGENEAFDRLKVSANEYEVSVNQLIDALVRLGYVQGEVSNTQSEFGESIENSKSKMIDLINSMSDGFDVLDKIYADVVNGGAFDFTNLDTKKFTEAFSGLEDEYTAFIETVSGSPDDINACQKAFDDLVTAFIEQKGILNNLTDENLNLTISMLKNMGVSNAEEVIISSLNSVFGDYERAKREAANAGIDLLNATDAEINSLIQEKLVSEETAQALFRYQLQKTLANENAINTAADCEALIALAKQCQVTGETLELLTKLRNSYNVINSDMWGEETKALAVKEAQKIKDQLMSLNVSASNKATISTPKYTGGTDTAKELEKNAKDAEQATKEYIDSYMNYMEQSLETGRIDYQTYSRDVSNFLKDMYDQGKIAAKDYHDYTKQMLEVQKSAYDKVISAVTHRIEQQIKVLEKQKESIESNYQSKIDAIQSEIDALEEANIKRKEQMELERLQYEAERARNQRTQLQYVGGQMVYNTDTSAIRDAEEEVAQKQHDMRIAELESQIKRLEEAMNAETDAIDSQIEKLNEYKDKWNEISEQYEIAQNEMIAQQILGADWETEILSGRLDVLNSFAESYFAIQQALADAAWASANEQIKAAQEAQKGADGTLGGSGNITPETPKDIKGFGTNKKIKPIRNAYSSSGNVKTSYAMAVKAKGGIITKEDSGDLDFIAKELGEDHIIGIQDGEAVVPKDSVKKNPELVDALINNDSLNKLRSLEEPKLSDTYKPLPKDSRLYQLIEAFQNKTDIVTPVSPFASKVQKNMENMMQNMGNINNTNYNQPVTIGDIHVHCPGITKDEVAQQIGTELHNQFRGLSLNAYQRSNISR